MPRVQVGYNPGAEALQTTATPNIQTERVANDPGSLKAVQLAEAVASPSAMQQFDVLSKKLIEEERKNAISEARNMSNDDLEKRIKDGSMLPFQSPVRVAAMHHVYGENLYNKLEMDVTSRAARGEFATWDDAQKYLTEQRKTMLGDQDKFTSAGFDKYWPQLINKVQTLQLHSMNANAVEFANTQGNQKLNGVITRIDSGEEKDGAQALGDAYRDAVNKKLFATPAERSKALNGVLTSLTAKGNADLVESFLKQKLDNGATVADVVGPEGVGQYRHQLQIVAERNRKQAAQAQIQSEAERTHTDARTNIERAVSAGNYAFLPMQQVVNPNTGVREDMGDQQKKIAAEAINRQIATNNLSLDKQMQLWSTNGLQNPEWEKQIQAGVSNVASVGWSYDGKEVGKLNKQGEAAISRYIELANVNPGEADKYAGGKENQRLLSDIKFMVEKGGMPNVNDAAAFVNQVNRRGIETQDAAIKRDQVKAAVDDIVNPHFYSGAANWVSTLFGGNESVNLTAIGSDIRRRSELLVQSGQVPDAKAAVQASVEYFANPAITTKINNTLYFNKDLPSVPAGERVGDWMERFIKEVPGKTVGDQQVDSKRIRIEPNTTGGYTAWIGGVPMTDKDGQVLNYSKESVTKWINDTYLNDIREKTGQRNASMKYDNWVENVKREYYGSKKGQVVPGQSGAAPLGYITSHGAYERLKAANMLGASVPEMVEFFKTKKDK